MKSVFENEVQVGRLEDRLFGRQKKRFGWRNICFTLHVPRASVHQQMSNAEFAHRLRTTKFGLFGSMKALQNIAETEYGHHSQ